MLDYFFTKIISLFFFIVVFMWHNYQQLFSQILGFGQEIHILCDHIYGLLPPDTICRIKQRNLSHISRAVIYGDTRCNYSAEQKIVLHKITFSHISQDEIHKWNILKFIEALSYQLQKSAQLL